MLDLNNSTSSGRQEGHLLTTLAGMFLVVALLAGWDLGGDLREGTTVWHLITEGAIFVAGLIGVAMARTRVNQMRRMVQTAEAEARLLADQLEDTSHEAQRWRVEAERWRAEASELMAGLGAAIETQFSRWQLSPAEQETGLLLLKGLSHKEIAAARSVTEATARQQARAVYRKGGLTGRHDLSAFFLEDLLLPISSTRG